MGDKHTSIIFFENRIIAIGDEYILSFNYDCGYHKFQDEKAKLKIRHEKEYKILFKPSELEWNGKIVDSRFEDLIKDLLEREPEVTRVRKTAHTRERDGGVDLIVDWKVPKSKMYTGDINPYHTLKIIVQCKAYKEGVSKSKVTDIRDTIEFRNYDGYFLVVSSYLTKSLSDYLDKLRTENKFWIEWWSRDEIEKRLINHINRT
ncbi:MAG: restriction endonuclease [Saprospiraceae bacterium]|nr:restriction endonuclease [Saprospiraceae bacterium]